MPFPVRRTLSARLLAPLRDSKTVASCRFSSFYIYSIYCGKISLFYTTYTERVRSLLCTVISLVFAVAKAHRVKAPLSQTRACGNSIYHKREFKIAFPFPPFGGEGLFLGIVFLGLFCLLRLCRGGGDGGARVCAHRHGFFLLRQLSYAPDDVGQEDQQDEDGT